MVSRQLLRIATAGSVDDGKSTLIGRLMHDTDSLPLDHLEAVKDEEGVADLAALSDTDDLYEQIKAGTFWINDPLTDNDAGPFGGFKQSGIGREGGVEGLHPYLEAKTMIFETMPYSTASSAVSQ